MFKQIYHIAQRECGIMWKNPIYLFCMVIFPIVVILFFTSLMKEGVPTDMPVGVVDQDNSSTSRALVRKLDAFQTTHVVAHYENMNEARKAIQRNEIYAFLLIPNGTEKGLMTSSQPKVSFYYSSVSLAAGSLLMRDLKTISTLGSAAVGMQKLSALGKTSQEIATFLQPIAIDLHMIGNPYANYNYYLSSVMVPASSWCFYILDYPILHRNRTEVWKSQAMDEVGGQQSPHCHRRQDVTPDDHLPHHLLCIRVLYLLCIEVPASRRRITHSLAGFSKRLGLPKLRHIRLRTDAVASHVDEYLFTLGCGQFLHLWSHLPYL